MAAPSSVLKIFEMFKDKALANFQAGNQSYTVVATRYSLSARMFKDYLIEKGIPLDKVTAFTMERDKKCQRAYQANQNGVAIRIAMATNAVGLKSIQKYIKANNLEPIKNWKTTTQASVLKRKAAFNPHVEMAKQGPKPALESTSH